MNRSNVRKDENSEEKKETWGNRDCRNRRNVIKGIKMRTEEKTFEIKK